MLVERSTGKIVLGPRTGTKIALEPIMDADDDVTSVRPVELQEAVMNTDN